ncbi:hypothetical protein ACFLWY_05725 [Chloroflexota bacterium]
MVSISATPQVTKGTDDSAYATITVGLERIYDPATGDDAPAPDGIGGYGATLTYDGAGINIVNVLGLAPFDDVALNIDDAAGTTAFNSIQAGSAPQAPLEFANVYIRLSGACTTSYDITLPYDEIIDVAAGDRIYPDGNVAETFLRGDAKPDGSVGLADALFIAQYLAGIRALGQDTNSTHPINAASVKHDGANGDLITVADVLFIRHYLIGVRDVNFTYTG